MIQRPSQARTGLLVLCAGFLLLFVVIFHDILPQSAGFALVVESLLPWVWVLLIGLAVVAVFRFSLLSVAGVLAPTIAWVAVFHPYLKPDFGDSSSDLTIATQNVGARLPQPTATAKNLIARNPDIVTVQEIESLSGQIIKEQLDEAYKYSMVRGTIGVWSKWRISPAEEINLGLSWPRAFATTIATDQGNVQFYSVHLPSVRPGEEDLRNSGLQTLSDTVRQDHSDHIIVAGDFNSAATDRHFDTLLEQLTDTRQAVGGGFGFTWPAMFPVTRLDHILVHGFDPVSDDVIDRGTSDHRAVIAGLNYQN